MSSAPRFLQIQRDRGGCSILRQPHHIPLSSPPTASRLCAERCGGRRLARLCSCSRTPAVRERRRSSAALDPEGGGGGYCAAPVMLLRRRLREGPCGLRHRTGHGAGEGRPCRARHASHPLARSSKGGGARRRPALRRQIRPRREGGVCGERRGERGREEGRLQGCLARAPPAAAPAREERWLVPGLGSPASRLTPAPLLCMPAVGDRKGGSGSRGCAVRGAGAPPAGRRAPSRGIGGGRSGAHAGGGAESSTQAAVPGG
jgi:hypothetical protein